MRGLRGLTRTTRRLSSWDREDKEQTLFSAAAERKASTTRSNSGRMNGAGGAVRGETAVEGEGAMDARTQTGRGHGFGGLGMILGNGWLDFGVIGVAGMLASFALATVWGPAEAQMNKKAGVERGVFGKLDDSTAIEVFTLRNSKGAAAKIITYGGTLTELWVPDRTGKTGDVVLGFDDLKGYLGDHPHFGGVIGRYANRIAKGKFSIDGQEYTLATNNGPNTLHGGTVGFDHRVWKGEPISGDRKSTRLNSSH